MGNSDVFTTVGLIVSLVVPVTSAFWYIVTHPGDRKKVLQTAILTTLTVSLLAGGVLFVAHASSSPGGPMGNNTPSTTQKASPTAQSQAAPSPTPRAVFIRDELILLEREMDNHSE
jgi:hypothetical protein